MLDVLPAALVAATLATTLTAGPADLVIENARIWSAGRAGFAEFAAVTDGRFVHVGEHDATYIDRHTRRVDAGGRVVVPGLIDSHVHMLGGGTNLMELQLRDVSGRAEFIRRVADWAQRLDEDSAAPAGETWIRGGRWSTESWDDSTPPKKEWIDDASGGHPLYLPRMDGHSALVNSAALDLAGITRDSPPDPEGGLIDRDPVTREPTGILRESAMGLVGSRMPTQTKDDKLLALARAMREANRRGITAVADIPGLGDLDVYESLTDVTVRFYLYPTANDWEAAVDRIAEFSTRPHQVQVNGLKLYLDGSLGSRTAYMREPFLGNEPGKPHWRGLLREGIDGGQLRRRITIARDAGLQTIAHAIGDEANHLLLETLAEVYGDTLVAARCRSEHAQHLLPEDVARFGALGVIPSMQPFHKSDDGRYAESYIGEARSASSYAFRSLLNTGAVLVFGSDWPVVSIDPFLGVDAAVTGRTLDGRTWQPQENLTVGEALRSYTDRAAYGVFAEDEIGRIAPGFRADFVILESSPFDGDAAWSAMTPRLVFVDGRVVFPDS